MKKNLMELDLKIRKVRYLEEEKGHEACVKLIDSVDNGKRHTVKLMTNKLEIETDRIDQRFINSLKRVKMVFKKAKGGCIILMGHLSCTYVSPYGGEFMVFKAIEDDTAEFSKLGGVSVNVEFCNRPTDNKGMQNALEKLKDHPDFVSNIEQFGELMELFEYYMALSAELNNNVTYAVKNISAPFKFVPIDEKDVATDAANEVKNSDGVVVGYKLEDYRYDRLPIEKQERVREYVEIELDAGKKSVEKIRRFSDDLYLNKFKDMDEDAVQKSYSFELACVTESDNKLVLMGAPFKSGHAPRGRSRREAVDAASTVKECKYLHLYDMGQKIKNDSIANSLRLIKQGESCAATELLKYLIGDADMPSKTKAPRRITEKKKKYVENLNKSQCQAFLMATDGSPVSLIKGPPGTGKTHVINAIVRYITKELGEKVVISSQTHVAIDNVLDKLMENYDLVIPKRITNRRNKYSGDEIDETLYKTWGQSFEAHNKRSRNAELAAAIASDMESFNGDKKLNYAQTRGISGYSVIGATTTTSAISGKRGLEVLSGYDWLVIDEVSKCPITEVLRYLPYVSHIIMVGDDFQLAPKLEFDKREVEGLKAYDEQKFDRLEAMYTVSVFDKTLKKAAKSGRLCVLDENYRSVKGVLATYNIFYDGELKNKRERIRPRKIRFKAKLKSKNKCDAFFVDVKGGKQVVAENKSRYNVEELVATASVLTDLLENTDDAGNATVSAIFPYSKQLEMFRKRYTPLINRAKQTFKSFEMDTVDAFQGRETDIVLVGTVVTEPQGTFLQDFRRINVAMSRARDKLFVFGNPITLSQIEMKNPRGEKRTYFAEIIADIRRSGGMIIFNGEADYESYDKSKIAVD